ncbi:MAG: hypothetical protein HYX41_07880 [Bdellovibrio sp.]|nr:hypothetical protein [Bdellovibrio sp.]
MEFSFCPRCCDKSYEHLATHAYCVNCNYSPTLDEYCDNAIPDWALEVLKESDALAEGFLPSEFPKPLTGFVSRPSALEQMTTTNPSPSTESISVERNEAS